METATQSPAVIARKQNANGVALGLNVGLLYTQGDSDAISVPAGSRCHLVGKTLKNVFHCDTAEIRFVRKLVIMQTFS